jgi:hypothetical protein
VRRRRVFRLEDIREAHRVMESNEAGGKRGVLLGPIVQAVTVTPFQNATYPAICLAASFGSG